MRGLAAAAAGAVLLAGGAAGATDPGSPPTATGFAVKIVVPGQQAVVAAAVAAPPDEAPDPQPFAYPADGSVVQSSSAGGSAQADAAQASAAAEVHDLVLFGGDVRASLVSARADTAGAVGGSSVVDLVVLGQPVDPKPGLQLPLADWGTATVLEETTSLSPDGRSSESATGLDVRLTAPHGGLPAGSEIVVGRVDANPERLPVSPDTTSSVGVLTPPPTPERAAPPPPAPKPLEPPAAGHAPTVVRRPPADIHPALTAGPYVFPVYGASAVDDAFGSPQDGVAYRHGIDVRAPMGTPVVAAADGRVFAVGWSPTGGNRLWLQDGQGNQFYYAELAAFAPAARNGSLVRAGTVLGFVGDGRDGTGAPTRLHFEVHPVSLLYLGYDGAVDPTTYLASWSHLRDVSFDAARVWVPAAETSTPAPPPGAVLLGASDISWTSGLVPGALPRAAAAPVSAEGDGAPVGAVRAGG